MKSQSNNRPPAHTVEQWGDIAEVVLYENVTAQDGVYTYDEYRLNVPWRADLSAAIEGDRAGWLSVAMQAAEAPPPLTLEQQLQRLEGENRLTADALEELISVVMGGA